MIYTTSVSVSVSDSVCHCSEVSCLFVSHFFPPHVKKDLRADWGGWQVLEGRVERCVEALESRFDRSVVALETRVVTQVSCHGCYSVSSFFVTSRGEAAFANSTLVLLDEKSHEYTPFLHILIQAG